MRSTERDDFIKKVLGHVKFIFDHEAIREELEEHMEDMAEEFKEEGMDAKEAMAAVVLHMGDPDEIGEQLNKAHKPLLGTVWLLSKTAAIIMIVITCLSLVMSGVGLINNLTDDYDIDKRYYGDVLYTVDVGEKFKIDDLNIVIDELIYYEKGAMEIRYRTWDDPFSKSINWTFNFNYECFTDEDGNKYLSGGGGGGGGPISRYQSYIEGFPYDAEKFIVNYDYHGRKIYCEIPLTEAREAAEKAAAENTASADTENTSDPSDISNTEGVSAEAEKEADINETD